MFNVNPITAWDFYKADHRRQYPAGTQMVYSNLTARSDRLMTKIPGLWDGKIVFFGLQAFIMEFLMNQFDENFFERPKAEVVEAFSRRMTTSLGPNNIGTAHIEALHDLGYLPLEIKALPEGSLVDMKVPVLTIKNTHPDFFWLTNMLETMLSACLWKGITSATTARQYRLLLNKYAELTGTAKEFVQWQGHDFSMRGMSGLDDACLSGAGHLLSFTGTDTVPAIDFLEAYYFVDAERELIGGSVAATEHSVMCMGMQDGEYETFRRLVEDIYPEGIVSIVSDTWDFWKVMTELAPALKDKILARNGKTVFRPDSGDPVKILCGYKVIPENVLKGDEWNAHDEGYEVVETPEGKFFILEAVWDKYDGSFDTFIYGKEITAAEAKGAVETLWETFGGTITEKGYRLLDQHVGLIYGDSITLQRAEKILSRLAEKNFASGNVVLGIGSYTYEYVTRDTLGMAMKATAGIVNGELREIFKDPATDDGRKKSAKGLLRVEKDEQGNFVLLDQQTPEQEKQGELKTVFLDGRLVNWYTLTEVRQKAGGF